MKNRNASILLLFISALLYYFIGYETIRDDFYQLIGLYGSLFLIYFYLVSFCRNALSTNAYVLLGFLLRAILLFSIPALSDDFYRFIWDGRIIAAGDNPFLSLPIDYAQKAAIDPDGKLFPLLNSPEYYSVYPPLLQYVFWISALISPSGIFGSVIVMKSFLLLTELGTLFMLPPLLKRLGLDKRLMALYALNPLAIVELVGNIHFEAFMIFFLVLALYLLAKNSWKFSAMAFGMAVAAKLLPLMFLPFFIKRLGWIKTIFYGVIVIAINGLLFLPFWSPEVFPNFMESVQLYFKLFEFNGSVHQIIRWVSLQLFDFNPIRIIGQVMPWVILISILILALLERKVNVARLPRMMLLAFSIYFALATTVNPWYISVFIVFSVLSGYRWAIFWTALIPLSYNTYRHGMVDEQAWVVALEYLPVYAFAFYEFGWLNFLKSKWALQKAQIKVGRLKDLYKNEERILEIGCGNGALVKLLREAGHQVETVDVENKTYFQEVQPIIYNGENLPVTEKQFSTVQMITMLHHVEEPEELIAEAKRVGRQLIIMEDIYSNPFQKYITWFTDSIVNWEFADHPHTNKTDEEWRETFERLNLKLEKVKYHKGFLLFFQQVTYQLFPKK